MRIDKGFTLLEILIVIAIIAITSSIAIPNMFSFVAGMRLRTASRDIYSDFQMTRIKAIRLNTRMAVRFNSAGYQTENCGGDNDCSVTSDNTVIKTVNVSNEYPGVTITTNPTNALVEFNSEGSSTAAIAMLTNSKGNTSAVIVALSGRISITP